MSHKDQFQKNSFSCLLNIVTCDRGVGRRTPFIRKKGCDNIFVTALFVSPETTADNRHLLFYRKKSKYQIRKKRPNNPIIGTKKIPAIKHKLINIEIKLRWSFDKTLTTWESGLFAFMICLINIPKEKLHIVYTKT